MGEWNHFEIRLENDLVTVHLNNQLVIDRFAAEFKRSRGPIVLEHHGPPLWFRNIYLKGIELKGTATRQSSLVQIPKGTKTLQHVRLAFSWLGGARPQLGHFGEK